MNHRICILGNSGSGKSALANELGRELGLPVFHLDREMLHGNFQKHSVEKRGEIHAELLKGDSWIIDGNYHLFLPDRVKRATLIIFLNLSRATALKRILRRAKVLDHPESSLPEEADKTKLSWEFIRWVLKYSRRKRLRALRELVALSPQAKLLVLRPGKLKDWVATIGSQLAS